MTFLNYKTLVLAMVKLWDPLMEDASILVPQIPRNSTYDIIVAMETVVMLVGFQFWEPKEIGGSHSL